MKRFNILKPMMTTGRPMAIAEADTAAEALKLAKEYSARGIAGIRIGDVQAQEYFDPQAFAARYNVR